MMGGSYREREKRKTKWATDDPVASAAIEELEKWTDLTESDRGASSLLRKYWKSTGIPYPGHETAWSGAFVSYVANKGAPGSLTPSGSHMIYAGQALPLKVGRYHTRRPNIGLQVGDIVIRMRGTEIDFSDIGKGHKPSHGDVVVSLQNGKAQVVGGNLSDRVEMREYRLTEGNVVAPGQSVLAVLRRHEGEDGRHEDAEPVEPSPDVVADIPGYRRAKQSEVTPLMTEAAIASLTLPVGSVASYEEGFKIAVVHHYKNGRRIKGAEVFLPLTS